MVVRRNHGLALILSHIFYTSFWSVMNVPRISIYLSVKAFVFAQTMYNSYMEIELTDKQIKFCEAYVVLLNATKAAITAGHPETSAASIGAENLTKPEIKRYILDKQIQFSDQCLITKNMIISELGRYGFRGRENSFADVKSKDAIGALIKIGEYIGVWQPEKSELEKKREDAEVRKISDEQSARDAFPMPWTKHK